MNFFDVKQSIKSFPQAITYITVGTRGVGKSYSPEIFCLEDAILKGRQFCLVGRFKEDVMPSTISNTFGHMTIVNRHTGRIPISDIMAKSNYPKFKTYNIESKAGQIWVTGAESEEDRPAKIVQVGVYTSIQTAERFKRGSYPKVYNIFFDEFITARFYICGAREPQEFEKIVNTIFRGGKDGKIFMAGNPDNEVDLCPYLTEYNIFYDEMEPNTIYPCNGGRVAFIKLTNTDNTEYIVKDTVSMFGVKNNTAFTGEVDRPEMKRIPEEFEKDFTVLAEFRVETSGIVVENPQPHRRCFFLYLGMFRGEWWIVTHDHHHRYGNPFKIVCKFEVNELPAPDETGRVIYTHQFNFDRDIDYLRRYVVDCVTGGRAYHETDKLANILRNLL